MYNYDAETLGKIMGLTQGFFVSLDSQNRVVVTIKVDVAILTSLIKGCNFYFLINKKNSLTSLIIEDNKKLPFYVIAKDFSENNSEFVNFENVIIELLKSKKIRINYFNDSNYQLFSKELNKSDDFENFKNWLKDNDDSEFKIEIKNIDLSHEQNLIFINIFENLRWNNEFVNGKPYYKFSDYFENGKHGYNQEHSLKYFFSQFFIPNEELFYSIKKINKEELTDFTIIYKKAILLIESKYTISDKQTKFNDSIVKSIHQLNNAENIIVNEIEHIMDPNIIEKVENFEIILKICVFNDDGRNLIKAFKNIKRRFDKKTLPIFISVLNLKQFLTYSELNTTKDYKVNIIENLNKLRYEFRENEIIVIDNINIENGIITLIE